MHTTWLIARDGIFDAVVWADAWDARRPARMAACSVRGAASTCRATGVAGLATVATVVGGADLCIGGVGGDLRQLETRAGVGEGREVPLEDLRLQFVLAPDAFQELKHEIAIVDGAADGVQIVDDRLKFAGVGGDGHVTARRVAEGLAKEEVPHVLIGEEELVDAFPGGVGEAIGTLNKAMHIRGECRHVPEADVDVHSPPRIIGIRRSGALCHVVEHLVHGEEELEDLAPLREVGTRRIHLKLDVRVDIDVEDRVGIGCGRIWGLHH
jgi:hypothetical protein